MAQKYAVVEFQSTDDIAIVDMSTVCSVDSTKLASLPCEAICDWKEKGKKKTKAYDLNVLRLEGMAYFRMLAASGTVIFVPHSSVTTDECGTKMTARGYMVLVRVRDQVIIPRLVISMRRHI